MNGMVSCEYNMDSGCVELTWQAMHVYVQIAHCLPRDTHLASNALVYTNAENRSDFPDRKAPVLLVKAIPQTPY